MIDASQTLTVLRECQRTYGASEQQVGHALGIVPDEARRVLEALQNQMLVRKRNAKMWVLTKQGRDTLWATS